MRGIDAQVSIEVPAVPASVDQARSIETAEAVPQVPQPVLEQATKKAKGRSIVYFLHDPLRKLVKIGSTRDLVIRLRAHRSQIQAEYKGDFVIKCLGTVKGGVDLERAYQQRWVALRIGRTEWFRADPALLKFIQDLKPKTFKFRHDSRETPFIKNPNGGSIRIDLAVKAGYITQAEAESPRYRKRYQMALKDAQLFDRCPCNKMTKSMATRRNHTCEAPRVMEWQPIHTAPKDGTRIDLWLSSPDGVEQWRETDCFWNDHRKVWDNLRGMWDCATHWMPRPDPPRSGHNCGAQS